MLRILCAAAALAASGVAAAAPGPVLVTSSKDFGFGVGQDARSLAWCSGNRLHVRALATGVERSAPATCPYVADVAVAGPRVAYGGYQEVRCLDTHSEVYVLAAGRSKRVALLGEGCIGEGDHYLGIVSDGTDLFYGVLRVAVNGEECLGGGPPCRYSLAGGGVYRIVGGRGVRVAGIAAPYALAAGDGLLALAAPEPRATWNGKGGAPFPRGARDGGVELRRSRDASLVSSFAAGGPVWALGVSRRHVVAAVEAGGRMRIRWFDARTGRAEGETTAAGYPAAGWPHALAVSGDRAVFVQGNGALWQLDLGTGARLPLARRAGTVVGVSLVGRRLVWAEQAHGGTRAYSLALAR